MKTCVAVRSGGSVSVHRHCQAKNSRRRKQSSYDIWVTSAVGHGFRWYVRGLLEILGFRQRLGNNIGVADGFGRKFCGAEVAVRMVRRAAEVGSSIFWARRIIAGLVMLVGRPGRNFGWRRRLSGSFGVSQAFERRCNELGANHG